MAKRIGIPAAPDGVGLQGTDSVEDNHRVVPGEDPILGTTVITGACRGLNNYRGHHAPVAH